MIPNHGISDACCDIILLASNSNNKIIATKCILAGANIFYWYQKENVLNETCASARNILFGYSTYEYRTVNKWIWVGKDEENYSNKNWTHKKFR